MARILIVDDDELLRALLTYRLSADGHDVLALEDGSRVLSVIEECRPDLIVLDAMMPVMDGFEILRRLKTGASPDSTPVIMLTALKREADIVGALELGAADYLAKPFIPDELSQRIRRVLAASPHSETLDARARRPG
ncbi:Alkaline phosphatase synthesis transcriptional regulatory protein PhoP [Brevundimonas sp. NIBR10]|uniref:response regulator transcription factor n=1 Tax=Brevundimonas sp. NIBR10 TaxID=3015997 RepID=UPI0022F17753|nr:response regulator [Brevundimonas sp. NIBR10]WGM47227.1 Alkaline phosphatase synthesis transcriptional regulatory protein PhoP [Brevundimonas sp. NIBR10]